MGKKKKIEKKCCKKYKKKARYCKECPRSAQCVLKKSQKMAA